MLLAKLDRKGQISIPKGPPKRIGVEGEAYFLVRLTPDGAILLRPAGVYPLEVYSEERIREFLEEDASDPEERERLRAKGAPLA